MENVTAHLVLSNTSKSRVEAMPKFISKSGTDAVPAITLPTVTLDSLETKEVDLEKLFSAIGKSSDFNIVSVEIDSESSNGSLIGAIYSRDNGTGLTFDTPLRDSGAARNMTGAYPWKADDKYSTLVYITNITDIKQNFVGQINFLGGHLAMRPRTLAPGETAIIDFRKLREDAFADDLGNIIPRNITQGQYMWSTRGRTGGKMALIGRTVMKSVSDDIVTSYSCPQYCPASYEGYITVSSNDIEVDDTVTATAWERSTYMGSTGGYYGVPADWSSSSNLSPNGSNWDSSQTFTGVGVGDDYITAWIGDYEHYTEYFTDDIQCMDDNYGYTVNDYKTVVVKPKLSSISPNYGAPASPVNVTLTGKGFNSTSTVSPVSGSTVSVSNVMVVSATQITATFTAAANANAGTVAMKVVTDGKPSKSKDFTIRIPHHLKVLNDNFTTRPADASCRLTPRPTERDITFEVVDSNGANVGPVSVSELFSNVSTNTCNSTGAGPNPAACMTTDANTNVFTDGITVNCGYLSVGCGYTITDEWQWCPTGRTGSPFTLATLTETVHSNAITVNGNSSGFSVGTVINP